MQRWQQQARKLKQEVYALYYACKDSRVPWYVKLLAGFVVAYALSPIDLIPDFIPVLGYLDDLLLIPFGIFLVLKLIPRSVMQECQQKAEAASAAGKGKPANWIVAGVILWIWLCLGAVFVFLIKRLVRSLSS